MFFLLRYSSSDGSLYISVLRSFRSAFKHWWRTFCVKAEPLTLQELVFTWHAVCTARIHYCDVSFCLWCVRSVHCARRSSSTWETLSTPTARTHCDLLCAVAASVLYPETLFIFFKLLKSLHWRWGWKGWGWGWRVVLHAFALIFRTVSTQTRLCHNLQTVQSGWALIFQKHPFHQRNKEKVWSHSS